MCQTVSRRTILCIGGDLSARQRVADTLRSYELARCDERSGGAATAQLAESFIERRARTRAHEAFVAAGGSRAHFERWWPQVFGSARANRSVSFA
jgi:hypothetical protein